MDDAQATERSSQPKSMLAPQPDHPHQSIERPLEGDLPILVWRLQVSRQVGLQLVQAPLRNGNLLGNPGRVGQRLVLPKLLLDVADDLRALDGRKVIGRLEDVPVQAKDMRRLRHGMCRLCAAGWGDFGRSMRGKRAASLLLLLLDGLVAGLQSLDLFIIDGKARGSVTIAASRVPMPMRHSDRLSHPLPHLFGTWSSPGCCPPDTPAKEKWPVRHKGPLMRTDYYYKSHTSPTFLYLKLFVDLLAALWGVEGLVVLGAGLLVHSRRGGH